MGKDVRDVLRNILGLFKRHVFSMWVGFCDEHGQLAQRDADGLQWQRGGPRQNLHPVSDGTCATHHG